MESQNTIVFYGLSTCSHCKKAYALLSELVGEDSFKLIYVDKMQGKERVDTLQELKKYNSSLSFPTIIINSKEVIIGSNRERIENAIGTVCKKSSHTENEHEEENENEAISTLRKKLTQLQEEKGYFFNNDTSTVSYLLKQLLHNKKRYGYMACPCRLAAGSMEKDKDIICPCTYREEDVIEHGVCFCGLYVSIDSKNKSVSEKAIPDRRPASYVS